MLALLGTPPGPERADASRNRELLLCTARRLLDEVGAADLSMDALAAEAGLGKGTVFRRFGSRAGLFAALLDEYERDFQAACLTGPAPLGPGAEPFERLVAFGHHRLRFISERADLIRAANAAPLAPGAPSGFSRLHLRVLLTSAGATGDVEMLAFNLHAALEAPLAWYVQNHPGGQRGIPHVSADRLARGWTELASRVVGSP